MKLFLDGLREQSLSFDLGDLDIAVRVSIQQQLLLDNHRQVIENLLIMLGETVADISLAHGAVAEDVIDLLNQHVKFRNKLNQTLRKDHNTVVLAVSRSIDNDIDNILGDLVQGLRLGLNLLGDQTDIGTSVQGALQSDVGGGAAHQPHKMVVLLTREGILGEVSDEL